MDECHTSYRTTLKDHHQPLPAPTGRRGGDTTMHARTATKRRRASAAQSESTAWALSKEPCHNDCGACGKTLSLSALRIKPVQRLHPNPSISSAPLQTYHGWVRNRWRCCGGITDNTIWLYTSCSLLQNWWKAIPWILNWNFNFKF